MELGNSELKRKSYKKPTVAPREMEITKEVGLKQRKLRQIFDLEQQRQLGMQISWSFQRGNVDLNKCTWWYNHTCFLHNGKQTKIYVSKHVQLCAMQMHLRAFMCCVKYDRCLQENFYISQNN